MDTTDPIDQLKAIRRVQQALEVNPNDIDALLELAAFQKKPALKRKLLAKVLSLEPDHQYAQRMLAELDRAATQGDDSKADSAVAPVPNTAESKKPVRFRYSIYYQVVAYIVIAIIACGGLAAVQDTPSAIVYTTLVLLGGLTVWPLTSVAEASGKGIKTYRLFGTFLHEMAWEDIASIKPYAMGHGMKLVNTEGKSIKISSQFSGYPTLVEILWQVRNDLFDLAKIFPAKEVGVLTLTGTFKKRSLSKYGLLLLAILASFLLLGLILGVQCVAAAIFTIVVVYLWRAALWSPYFVKLEGNELSVKSFVKEQQVTAQQIRDIDIRTLRTIRGIAHAHIEIEVEDEKSIALSGFPEGNEILYGVLRNWWRSHGGRKPRNDWITVEGTIL